MRNESKLNKTNREWMADDDNQAEAILAINETGGLKKALADEDRWIATCNAKIEELQKSLAAIEADDNVKPELKKIVADSVAEELATKRHSIEAAEVNKVNLMNLAEAGYIS